MNVEKAKMMMLGLAVGDALGGPVEFMSADALQDLYDGQIDTMHGGGWLSLMPGQTTDDTAMALCLLRSLAAQGKYNQKDAVSRYIAWKNTGPLDIGETVKGSLTLIEKGYDPQQAASLYHRLSGGMTASNGALMRIAPLALLSDETRHAAVELDASSTHYDVRSTKACLLFTDWLSDLLHDRQPTLVSDDPQLNTLLQADRALIAQSVNSNIGFAFTALGAGCWALRQNQPAQTTLSQVAGMGGDTDTNAAVAGALLGARYGDCFPAKWTDLIVEKQLLFELVEQVLS